MQQGSIEPDSSALNYVCAVSAHADKPCSLGYESSAVPVPLVVFPAFRDALGRRGLGGGAAGVWRGVVAFALGGELSGRPSSRAMINQEA